MAELAKECGWVEVICDFSERGGFDTAGVGEAAQVLAASNERAGGLSVWERVLPPAAVADPPALIGRAVTSHQ